MFWRKKAPTQRRETGEPEPLVASKPKTTAQRLDDAAIAVAASLEAYSEAAYRASQPGPDEELKVAYAKVEAARKLVLEGRLAYALGRCLPEHVKHWPSWSEREGFEKWVGFEATEINATKTEEEDGSDIVEVAVIDFTFNGCRYRLVLRDRGMSDVPDDVYRHGEIELFTGTERVAKFELDEDISKDFSTWEFSDVRALKVGPWMKDVLDMATQIEASRRKSMDDLFDQRTREAASEIDLG